jgi:RNA polymerase sigma-70 factor (ECF subfamily)
MVAREQLAQVWESVERLSEKQRTIFLLRFVDEMELSEIAVATGIALPTVKSHLYRALDHVRAEQSLGKREKR